MIWSLTFAVLAPLLPGRQGPPVDSAGIVAAVRTFRADCRRDSGRLWGRTLCGPLIVVDGETGFAVATAPPPEGTFRRAGAVWVGRVPAGMQVANTATDWKGERWSTVRAPLPRDRFLSRRLLLHEAFHRIQPALDLSRRDAINAHLDERDGRTLLRLELRALGRALGPRSPVADAALRDALIFRAQRHQRFPGADSLESALEIQEGLAEYTGTVLALADGDPAPAIHAALDFEKRPTFVRSLGYGTGPLLGLLLDRHRPRWRRRIATEGFAAALALAAGFVPPGDLASAVAQALPRYDGLALTEAEAARESDRAAAIAEYRRRLIDGPIIILAADEMMRSFNPNTLVPLGAEGTIYPTGSFAAIWGELDVTEGGALVPPANRQVRIPFSGDLPTTGVITGMGWVLTLKPGWALVPGTRQGDRIAVRSP